LVLGKPGCQGCAGSDYLSLNNILTTINNLDGKLKAAMGGVLWWDLCRLFGATGSFCVSGSCQPSWGGANIKANLNSIMDAMKSLKATSD